MSGLIDDMIGDLALFVRVIDCNGFTAASRLTGTPQATISRRIASLEKHLDTRLVNRSTRRLALTEPGKRIYEHAVRMVAQAEAAEATIANLRAEPSGNLRITCQVVLGNSFIGDIIARYMSRYPRVNASIEMTGRTVDLIEEGVDVDIRFGRPPDSNLAFHQLGDVTTRLCASCCYLAKRGRPQQPSDLAHHRMMMLGKELGPRRLSFRKDEAQEHVQLDIKLTSNAIHPLVAATHQHLGIALLPEIVAADLLEKRTLEAVLLDWETPPIEINALTTSHRGSLPAVRTFIDFVRRELVTRIKRARHAPSG